MVTMKRRPSSRCFVLFCRQYSHGNAGRLCNKVPGSRQWLQIYQMPAVKAVTFLFPDCRCGGTSLKISSLVMASGSSPSWAWRIGSPPGKPVCSPVSKACLEALSLEPISPVLPGTRRIYFPVLHSFCFLQLNPEIYVGLNKGRKPSENIRYIVKRIQLKLGDKTSTTHLGIDKKKSSLVS